MQKSAFLEFWILVSLLEFTLLFPQTGPTRLRSDVSPTGIMVARPTTPKTFGFCSGSSRYSTHIFIVLVFEKRWDLNPEVLGPA